EESLHRNRMNILSNTQENFPFIHPDFRKSLLPNRSAKPEFASCQKRKTAFDQLNRLLHGHLLVHRDQHVEVVGHDHKFVEKILLLLAIVIEHIDQETRCASRLQKSSFLASRGSDEECAISGDDV